MKIAALDYTVLHLLGRKNYCEETHRLCLLVLGIKVKESSFLLPGKWACWPLVNVFRLGQGLLRSEWSPYHSAPSEHSFLFFLVLPSDIYLQPQFTVVKKKRQRREKRNKMSLAHNVTALTRTSPMPWWAYCQQKQFMFQYSRTKVFKFCSMTCLIVHCKLSYWQPDWEVTLLSYSLGRTMDWVSWDFRGFPQAPRKIMWKCHHCLPCNS